MKILNLFLNWGGLILFPLISILFAIAIIHFYWVLGGKWGLDKVIPSKPGIDYDNKSPLFQPPKLATAFVGIFMLGIIGYIYLFMTDWDKFSSNFLFKYGLLIFSFIFFARAIGEFNYVGFFKKVKSTPFGKYDSKFFSPLSLLISFLFLALYFVTIRYSTGPIF